jgi:hypothetical protein
MTTRHPVDPELLPALDHIPDVTFTTESLGQMRSLMKTMQSHRFAGAPEYPGMRDLLAALKRALVG